MLTLFMDTLFFLFKLSVSDVIGLYQSTSMTIIRSKMFQSPYIWQMFLTVTSCIISATILRTK